MTHLGNVGSRPSSTVVRKAKNASAGGGPTHGPQVEERVEARDALDVCARQSEPARNLGQRPRWQPIAADPLDVPEELHESRGVAPVCLEDVRHGVHGPA